MTEVAHSRWFVFLNDGRSLAQSRRNANLVSKTKRFCILGPWDYSTGCNLIFAEVKVLGEAWSSSSEEPEKI